MEVGIWLAGLVATDTRGQSSIFIYLLAIVHLYILSLRKWRRHERTRESWLVLSEPSKQRHHHWPLSPPTQLLFFSESQLVTSCQLSKTDLESA